MCFSGRASPPFLVSGEDVNRLRLSPHSFGPTENRRRTLPVRGAEVDRHDRKFTSIVPSYASNYLSAVTRRYRKGMTFGLHIPRLPVTLQ